MNFYKHHLGDYDGDTSHLCWDEDMAYTRLLRAYYRRERPIGEGEAYRLARASSKVQRAAVDSVLREFFNQLEDGWHNKRADEEIATYQAQAETNRRIAKGRKRGRTDNEPSHDSYHDSYNEPTNESKSKRTPNHKPDTKNHKPVNKKESTPLAQSAARPAPAVNGKESPKIEAPAVVAIPLVDGSEFPITQSDIDEFSKLYPAVDVPQTLNEIRGWNLSNSNRRKTKTGVLRHVNQWLAKEQNSG